MTEPESMEGVDLERLPHWARVAYVARCVRRVLPLFHRLWPNALPSRRENVQRPVELAERSAAQGRAVADLKNAEIEARVVAGVAMISHYRIPDEQESDAPPSETALVAANIAAAASRVAETALANPEESARRASDAFAFASDIARQARELDALIGFEEDFQRLYQAAARGRWTDQTPVPPAVFGPLQG